MRKYQPIWIQLKKQKECAIAAPAKLHRRIIKGVIAEKYEDVGYKFLLSEDDKHAKIEYTSDGAKLSFKLIVYGINIGDL